VGRPRTPSNVLEFKGAFKKNPKRARQDAAGAGPINLSPPAELSGVGKRAWKFLAERLPRVSLTSSDEVAMAQAARTLAAVWELDALGGALNPAFPKLSAELRQWLMQLGMTPQARTKLGSAPQKPVGNKFADV
jgi:hypothetical protein